MQPLQVENILKSDRKSTFSFFGDKISMDASIGIPEFRVRTILIGRDFHIISQQIPFSNTFSITCYRIYYQRYKSFYSGSLMLINDKK